MWGVIHYSNCITSFPSTSSEPQILKILEKTLLDIQKGLSKLDLPSEDQTIANGEIAVAIKEAKKEKPELSKIKTRFERFIDTVKGAKKTIKDISDLYEPVLKIAKLVGLTFSI